MVIDRLLEDLALEVEPLAMCVVSSGWRLRLAQMDGATLHFVLEGDGQLRLSGGPDLPLHRYSLAIVPDHRGHALQVPPTPTQEAQPGPATATHGLMEHVAGIDGDRRLLVACGRIEALYCGALPVFALLDRPLVVDFADSSAMINVFQHLLEESTNRGLGHVPMLRALMNECLVRLLRRLYEHRQDDPAWLQTVEDPRMAAVLAAVLHDPAAPHTVDSLAQLAHLSRSAFAQKFVDVFDRTPMAFVRDVRLQRAAELLRTTALDTTTIAHRIGFASRSHFSRTFRQRFGAAPAEHRRRPVTTEGTARLPRRFPFATDGG